MAEYIERAALEHHIMTKQRYLTKDMVMDAAYEVNKFPAADVEPVRHGHWEMRNGAAWCSACKRCMNPALYGYPRCGLCGAHMDEEVIT